MSNDGNINFRRNSPIGMQHSCFSELSIGRSTFKTLFFFFWHEKLFCWISCNVFHILKFLYALTTSLEIRWLYPRERVEVLQQKGCPEYDNKMFRLQLGRPRKGKAPSSLPLHSVHSDPEWQYLFESQLRVK